MLLFFLCYMQAICGALIYAFGSAAPQQGGAAEAAKQKPAAAAAEWEGKVSLKEQADAAKETEKAVAKETEELQRKAANKCTEIDAAEAQRLLWQAAKPTTALSPP